MEADREEIHGDQLGQGYYVDRRFWKNGRQKGAKGYGLDRSREKARPPRIPKDTFIVCFKKGCHSTKHKGLVSVFRAAAEQMVSNSESSADTDESLGLDSEDPESANMTTGFYAHHCRASAMMGVSPDKLDLVVDSALIDTG